MCRDLTSFFRQTPLGMKENILAIIGAMGEFKKSGTAAVWHSCQLPDIPVVVVREQADTVDENVSVDF